MLVDAVESSRFITEKKSAALVKKLGHITNIAQAEQLNRRIYMGDTPKPENESIYCNVDTIHTAIQEKQQIVFRYFEYTPKKEKIALAAYHLFLQNVFADTIEEPLLHTIVGSISQSVLRCCFADEKAEEAKDAHKIIKKLMGIDRFGCLDSRTIDPHLFILLSFFGCGVTSAALSVR